MHLAIQNIALLTCWLCLLLQASSFDVKNLKHFGEVKLSSLIKRDNVNKILTKIIKVEKTVQDGSRIIATKIKSSKLNNRRNLGKKSQIESLISNKEETGVDSRLAQLLISYDLDSNPCETASEFNYFLPFPSDITKYIICDPWGNSYF
jgi:hypothetical protein